MDAVEFIGDLTFKMCLARGREYREQYESIERPRFDELFAAGDRAEGGRRGGPMMRRCA